MGSDISVPGTQDITDDSKFSSFNYGILENPEFFHEDNVSFFQYNGTVKVSSKYNNTRDPAIMASLISGFYENIPCLSQILEELLETDDSYQDPAIETAFNRYSNYLQNFAIRSAMFSVLNKFAVQIFNPWKISYSISSTPQLTADILFDICGQLYPTLKLKRIPKNNNFDKYFPSISSVIPASAFPPPTPDFLPHVQGHSELFVSAYPSPHGSASNGQFLFVLCSDGDLQIFTLLNNGALSAPLTRNLSISHARERSLIASPDSISIIGCSQRRIYSIKNLFVVSQNSQDQHVNASAPNSVPYVTKSFEAFSSCASDGINFCLIGPDFVVKIFRCDTFVMVRQIKLKNFPPFKGSFSLPEVPVVTNGTFLGFIIHDGRNCFIRIFSLISGDFIKDEPFIVQSPFSSCSLDVINRCYWTLIPMNNAKYGVRRFYYIGAHDPEIFSFSIQEKYNPKPSFGRNAFSSFASSFNNLMLHYPGSQIVPTSLYLSNPQTISEICELISMYLSKPPEDKKIDIIYIVQSLLIIIDVNINHYLMKKKIDEKIINNLLNLIDDLPLNLACFLFFSHLKIFLKFPISEKSLSIMHDLLQRMDNSYLIRFALRMCEICPCIAIIPFDQNNMFGLSIPNDSQSNSLTKPALRSFLLIHQRILISYVERLFIDDPFATVSSNESNKTVLDYFSDYSQIIVSRFDSALSLAKSYGEFANSLIFELFSNFIRLISSLTKYHTIAQMITALLQKLLEKFGNFVSSQISSTSTVEQLPKTTLPVKQRSNSKSQIRPNSISNIDIIGATKTAINPIYQTLLDESVSSFVKDFIFIFGKLASTLVMGGTLSPFELKFSWMMKSSNFLSENPSILNTLDSPSIEILPHKRIVKFIKDPTSLDLLYTKFRPSINKNLKDDVKEMDRISLMAFAQHLGIFKSFLKYNGEPLNPIQKVALDQMIHIRNEYRKLVQSNKPIDEIRARCLLLLRLQFEGSISTKVTSENPDDDIKLLQAKADAKAFSDFIISSYNHVLVKKILANIQSRIQTTLLGFGLIVRSSQNKIHPLFEDMISFTLSEISSFKGLSTILEVTTLKDDQKEQIHQFFIHILKIVSESNSNKPLLVAYRFFSQVHSIPDIQFEFLSGILKLFIENPSRMSLFHISMQLADVATEFPQILENLNNNPYIWTICSKILEKASASPSFVDKIIQSHANLMENHSFMHIAWRLFYRAINSPSLEESYVREQYRKMIMSIGEATLTFNTLLVPASEMVWVLRRTIKEKARTLPILINLITQATNQNTNTTAITGIFAVLGGGIEPIRPYCFLRYHQHRRSANDYLILPTNSRTKFHAFPYPFTLTGQQIEIDISSGKSYAIPQVTVGEYWKNYDFLLELFDRCFSPTVHAMIMATYSQAISNFMKNPDFVELLKPHHIEVLCECPQPFQDIKSTLEAMLKFSRIVNIKDNGHFGVFRHQSIPYDSYISEQIKTNEPFVITILCNPQQSGYVGIVTDVVDKTFARYSFIHLSDGRTFPIPISNPVMVPVKDKRFDITVKPDIHVFSVNGSFEAEFPQGSKFCLFFAATKEAPVEFSLDPSLNQNRKWEDIFDSNATPAQQRHGCIDNDINSEIISIPSWAQNMASNIPDNISVIPKFSLAGVEIQLDQKMKGCFITPPEYIIIHLGFATESSPTPVQHCLRGLQKQLSLQWTTVSLMRILINKPELLSGNKAIMNTMFSLLVIPLERFYMAKFEKGDFPFQLESPVWSAEAITSYLYMSFEKEAKLALLAWQKNPKLVDYLMEGLNSMSNSSTLHLINRPNLSHIFYPRGNELMRTHQFPGRIGIAVFNDFQGPENNSLQIGPIQSPITQNTPSAQSPVVIIGGPQKIYVKPPYSTYRDFSFLFISDANNSWVLDTSFELLLLLKHYLFLAKSQIQRLGAKTIFLKLIILQSPFILWYLPQFSDFIQIHVPTTPLDQDSNYKAHLLLMGSRINNPYSNPRLRAFYDQEHDVLNSKLSLDLDLHFPEFFSMKIPLPSTDTVQIPPAIIDPGAITGSFAAHILRLQLISRRFPSIVGFPFWNVLAWWIRISQFLQDGSSNDYIAPSIAKVSSEIRAIQNPSGLSIQIHLRPTSRLPVDSCVMVCDNSSFENVTIISRNDILKPIFTSKKSTFISLIDVPHNWEDIKLDVVAPKQVQTNREITGTIKVPTIHDRFISDITQFAVQWTDTHTDALMEVLPRDALRQPTFSDVMQIALGSSLCSQFSAPVVLLRALIIHHFNYIRYTHYNEVPRSLWESFARFMSNEDAADEISKSIECSAPDAFPAIEIDRHRAHRLIVDNRGSYRDSIISQLATIIKSTTAEQFRCRGRPWRVKFTGEQGIDAGGPGRELLTEAASSIFEPTSGLCIPTPNNRRKAGQNLDTFIPYESTGMRNGDYYAIGVLLGIIIRTGLSQDLPFAPFVWKFIAGERITAEDIIAVDQSLGNYIKNLREAAKEIEFDTREEAVWTCENWQGEVVVLPRHTEKEVVKANQVEEYISEIVEYRMSFIQPMLNSMKIGFFDNTRLKEQKLMTGSLLSRMAQGSGEITIQHLKTITQYDGFNGDIKNPVIIKFWAACERFTPEQRKLLLRFITTLTRLPNTTINRDFKIKIDKMNVDNPDQMLPTASTCFNKLHLPPYNSEEKCYEKLLYAITYCQTMENK